MHLPGGALPDADQVAVCALLSCIWWQRETATAFALNAWIEADRILLLGGEVEIVHTPALSGRGQKIIRCPQCRIAVWSNYAGAGDRVHFVRVGTLDRPVLLPPDIHIYTASRQPWVVLPAVTPGVKGFHDRRSYCPLESLERAAALKSPQR